GQPRATHQEFAGRVTVRDTVEINAHATHVMGTIVGSGVRADARGMATEALLDVWDFNNDAAEMAAAAGELLLSNHSYGTVAGWHGNTWYGDVTVSQVEDWRFGFYDARARQWDEIARDAPYYLIVKSAGNDRDDNAPPSGGTHQVFTDGRWQTSTYPRPKDGGADGYDCIATYGTAKNIVTVGAIAALSEGYTEADAVEIAPFSGWGPTDDGRIKPDLVASGIDVLSADAHTDEAYGYRTGTSTAAPAVTGALALLQQQHHDLRDTYMRAATLKGLAIHTADEAGPAAGPDYVHGWGVLNTARAATVLSNTDGVHLIEEQSLHNGHGHTYMVEADGTCPLRVTLSWTDVPGTPPARALNPRAPVLVNDLDLRLIGPDGQEHLPYTLNPAHPGRPAAHGDNFRDNVEMVYLDAPAAGTYVVQVAHKGELVDGPQPFSLLLSGQRATAALSLDGLGGSAFCTGGVLDVSFTASGAFDAGNVFTLELSDADGSFDAPRALDTLRGAHLGTFRTILPDDLPPGDAYRVRIRASRPAVTASGDTSFAVRRRLDPPAVGGPSEVCVGETLQLRTLLVEGATYQWHGPDNFRSATQNPVIKDFTAAQAGTYTLVVTRHGCPSPPATFQVAVADAPVIRLSRSEGMLYANGGGRYRWFRNGQPLPGSDGHPHHRLQGPGVYHVTAQNVAGCRESSDTLRVHLPPTASGQAPTGQAHRTYEEERTTGAADRPAEKSRVFPNPSRGITHLIYQPQANEQTLRYTLYHSTGRRVTGGTAKLAWGRPTRVRVSLHDQPAGM
ncbi:MAG: S8 family serine peptidase, partial [Catalinimonas sp.]